MISKYYSICKSVFKICKSPERPLYELLKLWSWPTQVDLELSNRLTRNAIFVVFKNIISPSLLQVLYLLRKMSRKTVDAVPALRSVLVTSCETAAGLQLCDRLAAVGFRVFAGHKPDVRSDVAESSDRSTASGPSSGACALLRSRVKQRESAAVNVERAPGGVVFVPLDVTREDSLHEAVVTVKRHLPAGEDGQYFCILCTRGIIAA